MDYYYTAIALLGLRDSNLPPFKSTRKSIGKLTFRYIGKRDWRDTNQSERWSISLTLPPNLLLLFLQRPSSSTQMTVAHPSYALSWLGLAEWDDDMTYPVIQHSKYYYQLGALGLNLVRNTWKVVSEIMLLRLFMLTTITISPTISDLEPSDTSSHSSTSTSLLTSTGTVDNSRPILKPY